MSLINRLLKAAPRRGVRGVSDISGYSSQVLAVLGGQWGDEGKGKLVDVLAKRYDIVARFNGGANAGHTLVVNGRKFAFHLLPCGLLYPGKINIIGNGVVLEIETMLKELKNLTDGGVEWKGRLKISNRAHLLFGFHKLIDGAQEAAAAQKGTSIGTTKRGIGPCYTSKATRNGIRVGELLNWDSFKERYNNLLRSLQSQFQFQYDGEAELKQLSEWRSIVCPMIIDSVHYLHQAHQEGKSILAEGANAALLDVDFGTYPYVTSSSTAAGGVCTGLGLAPSKVETVIGIVKAYTTRVGGGPFPTELLDQNGERLRSIGREFGTTTGRPRRCGWLDLPVVQFSHVLNNYSSINITKLDVLTGLDQVKVAVAYSLDGKTLAPGQMPAQLDDLARVQVHYETLRGWKTDISKVQTYESLPAEAKDYIEFIEKRLKLPVSWIGVGPGREEMVTKGFQKQ